MKTLVLGSKGQLGLALAETAPDSVEFIGLDLPELDICSADGLMTVCRELKPAVIINAAAYTAVDKAESEALLADAVNAKGPGNVAAAARDIGARLIHISTDYVFDGKSSVPYPTDAATNPLNVYGRTKRDGELAALQMSDGSATVIRTSWLYSKYGNNFVRTMLRLMAERDELSVVADQFGSPTWSNSLASAVWTFAGLPQQSGIFHWSDAGETTWHEFAVAIQKEALSLGLLKHEIRIHAIKTSEFPGAAARPRYTVLDCASSYYAIKIQPAPWRNNVRLMLVQMAG